MLSEHRDMAVAQAFFRSAKSITGITPERVTTDGHGSYPRAIRSTLGRQVVHRTNAYKNNGLEQDHRTRGRFTGSTKLRTGQQRWKALKIRAFHGPNRPMLHLRAREFAPVTRPPGR